MSKLPRFSSRATLTTTSALITPGDFSPRGDVLDHNASLLFRHRERRCTYIPPGTPPPVEDKRLRGSLGKVASLSHQTLASIDGLKLQIAERALAEAVLRELNETLEQRVQAETRERLQIWNNSQDLLAIVGLDGKYLSVNPAWTEVLGWSEVELLGKSSQWLLHPDDRERTRAELDRLVNGHKTMLFENRLRAKDGSYHWISWKAVPDNEQIYGMGRDITKRKRADEARRELESSLAHVNRISMLGELASSLSHEITQPIASARNNARAAQIFLEMQPPEVGEVRQALACVIGDIDRAGDIIDRIREQMKKAPPRKEPFDLNAAINEVMILARSVIITNRVAVQTRFAKGLCAVEGDRVQLQQVVLNLILNAVEAMGSVEAGARDLLISSEEASAGVLVAVRDSGPGIDPTQIERVFEAFYTTKSGGVGMGLSICRSIIAAHGGRLWAEANQPRGAVLQFTLPGS